MDTTILDPVQALLRGRTHYKRPVAEPRGEPTLSEVVEEMFARCEAPMVAVEGQAGQTVGYRCTRCGTLASPEGRTENGPPEIIFEPELDGPEPDAQERT